MKVAIVGAGIMGRILAFTLMQAQHEVNIFAGNERVSETSCSMAAAGLLAPISELEKSPLLIYNLGSKALAHYWPLIMQNINRDLYFSRKGSLALAHPQDAPDLIRFIDMIKEKFKPKTEVKKQAFAEVTEIQPFQKLNQQEISELEPELTKFNQAYYFKNEGHLDSQAVMLALKEFLCKQENIFWHNLDVRQIFAKKIICQNKQNHFFDCVFDCRGLGGKDFFPNLKAIRGELIWLHAPHITITRPIRIQHPRHSLYLVPRPNHVYLIGASEIHAENYDAISVRSVLEFLTTVFYLHSGFSEARIQKTVTQCRSAFPDYLPKIRYQDGLVSINGLYRHGFLIAPTLAAEILAWLKDGKSALLYPEIGEFL